MRLLQKSFWTAVLVVLAVGIASSQTASPTGQGPADSSSKSAVDNSVKNNVAPAGTTVVPVAQEPAGAAALGALDEKPAVPPEGSAGLQDLRVSTGDLISMDVFGMPEMHTEARVNTRGEFAATLLPPVKVSGLTALQMEKTLEQAYVDAGVLKTPHILVSVKEPAAGVTLMGEVARPGIYSIWGTRRLFDVLGMAGGLSPRAGTTITVTHRDSPNQPEAVRIAQDLSLTPSSNINIQPGDTVMVARAGIVYVAGEVNRPGGYVIDNTQLTILQAYALAGGPTRVAKLNGARIIRKTPTGREEIPVKLSRIVANKSPDIPLQNDDILFVPSSVAKNALRRSTESAITLATSLAIYRF